MGNLVINSPLNLQMTDRETKKISKITLEKEWRIKISFVQSEINFDESSNLKLWSK